MADPSDLEIWVCEDSKPARAAGIALRGNLSDFVAIVHWLFQGIYCIYGIKCEKMQTYPQTTAKTFCTMYCCPLLQCPLNLLGLWVFFLSFYILYPSSLTFLCRFSSSFNLQDYCPRRHSSCGQIFHLHQGRAHLQVFLSKKKPSEATEIGGWLKRKKKPQWSWGIWQMKTRWFSMIIEIVWLSCYSLKATNINNNSISQCKSM